MTDLDLQVMEVLEEHVRLRNEAQPAWRDVLVRAGIESRGSIRSSAPTRRRRPRRFALAGVAVGLGLLALSPLGPAVAGLSRDAFDGLNSWLRGQPGEPATPAEQAGFTARNDASYAGFPEKTTVRLLKRETVGGQTFSLLGFRNASSLCLRLVRVDRPAARGANQCVTLRELRSSPAPVLVASEAWFRFGDPETTVEGVFGFADDTVSAVEVRRVRSGWARASVASNVFVALRARRSGSMKDHPPRDPIVQVRALERAGGEFPVPFVASEFADYGQGLPESPSYLKVEFPKAAALPGPAKIDAELAGGTIGWVARREARGERWKPGGRFAASLGQVVYSRSVQPDPNDPHRIGIAIVRVSQNSRLRHIPAGREVLCHSDLRPLQRGEMGASCLTQRDAPEWFERGRPLTIGFMGPEQITRFNGLAADGVARIELQLASGRRIPAALRNNAYTVSAPSAQFPAKMIAYGSEGKVVGLEVFAGPAKPAPCPPAVFNRPTSELPAPRPHERLDIGAREVNGLPVFGRSVDEVTAALGRPDRIAYFSTMNGHREPTLFYGGTTQGGADLLVQFGWRQQRLRAVSLNYRSPNLVEKQLGRILRMQPSELERKIAAAYGRRYDLTTSYGSEPARGCVAVFQSRGRAIQLSLSLDPRRPSRPSLTLHHGF